MKRNRLITILKITTLALENNNRVYSNLYLLTSMSSVNRVKDGFLGEKQINVPRIILDSKVRNIPFLNSIFITHIGYFPKAQFHFRERKNGCEDYILIYCMNGKGAIETPKGKFELIASQFIILAPNQYHRYEADINYPWSIYWVHFSGEKLNELNLGFNIETYSYPTSMPFSESILDIWNEMYSSLESGYTGSNIGYANFCLYRFISFFLFSNRKNTFTAEDDQVDKAINYMKSNIGTYFTVEMLAERFNYSASHFGALFKKKTGMSPIEYFIQIKIQHACQLLIQRNLKIKEIGETIGYDDPYYFSRLFKKAIGKSPNQYRLDYRED